MDPTKKIFVWKKDSERQLLREISLEEPFKFKFGTRERGASWNKIAESLQKLGFKVTQRSVRDKFEKMMKEHISRESCEAKGSGVEVPYDEIFQAMTDIKERVDECEESRMVESEKKEKEKATAEDMRKKATEKLKETKKRKIMELTDSEGEGDEPAKKKRPSTGRGGIVEVMKDSVEMKKKQQEEQNEIRLKELELRSAELKQQQEFNVAMMETFRHLISSIKNNQK